MGLDFVVWLTGAPRQGGRGGDNYNYDKKYNSNNDNYNETITNAFITIIDTITELFCNAKYNHTN